MHIESCKDCNDRFVGCHGTCERYKADKEKYDAERTETFKKRMKARVYDDYKVKNIRRMHRLTKNV